jgi:hypothetical protein
LLILYKQKNKHYTKKNISLLNHKEQDMKDLLIVFVVLLVLLTLISTLGGSVYPKEYFTDDHLREKFWQEEEKKTGHTRNSKLVGPEHFWEDATPTATAVAPAPPTLNEKKEEIAVPPALVPKVEGFKQEEQDIIEGFDGDMYASVAY